ncbi:P-loop containing nucleoside triphosphate hydrolase protein [Histomonas meleagridis]|uniref:P-loop containing nucleoside triphosphate hydrolase protein n=1 Tax=Histomonas meleagridis TaxID=135588 RepID=UPI003559A1A4|nr:P-loop containing nucleoside triphosphate hydrolase protein [Histomonas meleagridis]KAH0798706.1 P-loop containing nucleoside triphosphate hydrolase protein [Histomonas meleagridis]
MIKFAKQFPNVIPFLIYIKKEEFHIQRFAVRAKYMTTDPSMNKYTRNFAAIRHVQSHLSECATRFLIPKIDNRNIDRSMETMHQTIFSYLKKLKGRDSMYDPETGRLTFLASIWKRRKQKTTSKSKTLSSIQSLKNEVLKQQDNTPPSDAAMKELLAALPVESGIFNSDDMDGDVIQYLPNGTMMVKTSKQTEEVVNKPTSKRKVEKMAPGDFVETETETDIAEVTLTDFMETTDTESDIKFSMNGYHQFVKE